MEELTTIGRPARRVDVREKVLGSARFTDDLNVPGMLVAKVLRSSVPYAEIVAVDVTDALLVPGVKAAITSEDFIDHGRFGFPVQDNHMLAYCKVRYIGDPIAAVAAESEEAAEAGLTAIRLKLRPLSGVFNMHGALEPTASVLHEERVHKHEEVAMQGVGASLMPSNLSETLKVRCGDPLTRLAACDVVLDEYYSVPHQEHAYLETEAALAVPTREGGVTVYVGDQSPFFTQSNLVMTLGLRLEQVRVVQAYVGGAFGGKSDMVYQCAAQAARLALQCGRPVKLTTSREESMVASYRREAMEMRYRLGADKDGTLRAAKIDLWADSGAYASQTPLTGFRSTVHAMGPYRYTDCHVDFMGIYTNNGYSGAFRGFGNPEVTAASEQAIDELAERCGLDPIEFRLKNCVVKGDVLPFGQKLEASVGLRACLERVRVLSDWDRRRAEYAGQPPGQERRRGIGLASFFHGVSLGAEGLDRAVHVIRVEPDGRFGIITGFTDYGQGARTVFCMMAAEVLGLPMDRFFVYRSDTDLTYDCGPTVASRATVLGGNATRLAALELAQTLRLAAAMALRCEPAQVAQHGEDFVGPGVGPGAGPGIGLDGRGLCLNEVLDAARAFGLPLSATGRWETPKIDWSATEGRGTPYSAYHFGAQVAEVEVDRRTGEARVVQMWAVHDVGKVVFPEGARGQVIGGISQGLGYALTERVDFEQGRIVNDNFDSYLIPTAVDMPPVTVDFVEDELPYGPFGAKNVAEPPMVPTAPAILNAIYHATGRRIRHLPATLERVLLGHDLRNSVVTLCQDGAGETGYSQAISTPAMSTPSGAAEADRDGRPGITVSVRYGGMLVQKTGLTAETVGLQAGATLEELADNLWQRHPDLAEFASPFRDGAANGLRWIVDGQPAKNGWILADDAEVSLLLLAGGG